MRLLFNNPHRVTKRNRITHTLAFVNLVFGFGFSTIFFLLIMNELSYDTFNENADRIVRVGYGWEINGSGDRYATTPEVLGPTLKDNFPEIISFTRLAFIGTVTLIAEDESELKDEKEIIVEGLMVADSTFFSVFTYDIVKGDINPFRTKDEIVLTETLANRMFGDQNPIGKIVKFEKGYGILTVSAVIKDPPQQSHIDFSGLIHRPSIWREQNTNWDEWWDYTYLLLDRKESLKKLENTQTQFVNNNIAPTADLYNANVHLLFQPIKRIHLESNLLEEMSDGGNWLYVGLLGFFFFLLLILMLVNNTNLKGIVTAQRSKEIIVRRISGASKSLIVRSILGQGLIITFLAWFIGFTLCFFLAPYIKEYIGLNLDFELLMSIKWLVALFVLLWLFETLSVIPSSSYIASISRDSALAQKVSVKSVNINLQKFVILFQLIVVMIITVSNSVIFDQLKYIFKKDLGFNPENVVVVKTPARFRNITAFADIIENESIIESASCSDYSGEVFKGPYEIDNGNGEKTSMRIHAFTFDADYARTLDLKIQEGRNFTKSDKNKTKVLINEAAAQKFGWEEPVGRQIFQPYDGEMYEYEVLGVLKDFHFTNLKSRIEPLIIYQAINGDDLPFLYVRFSEGSSLQEGLSTLETRYQEFFGNVSMEYEIFEDRLGQAYRFESSMQRLLQICVVSIVLLSCFGLYALVSFFLEQRTKELGLRKLFGSSETALLVQTIRVFGLVFLLSAVVGGLTSTFLMSEWLNGFYYRTDIGAKPYFIAISLILLIIVIAIAGQLGRVFKLNPAKLFRDF